MSLIAIGDVHGCRATLDVLLDRLAPAAEDRLVFVGDYIDRGPDSHGVIERLLALADEHPCTFLRGNHEALMLDYLSGQSDVAATRALRLWHQNGGDATLRSYADDGQTVELPEAHLTFIRETKLYHETDDFFFVHAGLAPDRTIEENVRAGDEQTFLWTRSHMKAPAETLAWEKPVVCGHTPVREPVDHEKLLAIDTGCVYHRREGLGRLTAVRLPERDFVSVKHVG